MVLLCWVTLMCAPAPASGKIMQAKLSQSTVYDWLIRDHCHAQIYDWSARGITKYCLTRVEGKAGGPEMRALSVTWRSLKGRDICFYLFKENPSNSLVL